MGFFIGINLILTVVLIFAVLLLFLRQNRLIELEKKYDKLNRDLENSIAAFLIEIREENEEFLKKFKETMEQKSYSENNITPDKEIFETAPKIKKRKELEDDQGEIVLSSEKIVENNIEEQPFEERRTQADKESANAALLNHEDLKRKVKTLLESGFSIEEIAKHLNRGKTEISLLIKFDPELLSIEKNQIKK